MRALTALISGCSQRKVTDWLVDAVMSHSCIAWSSLSKCLSDILYNDSSSPTPTSRAQVYHYKNVTVWNLDVCSSTKISFTAPKKKSLIYKQSEYLNYIVGILLPFCHWKLLIAQGWLFLNLKAIVSIPLRPSWQKVVVTNIRSLCETRKGAWRHQICFRSLMKWMSSGMFCL